MTALLANPFDGYPTIKPAQVPRWTAAIVAEIEAALADDPMPMAELVRRGFDVPAFMEAIEPMPIFLRAAE